MLYILAYTENFWKQPEKIYMAPSEEKIWKFGWGIDKEHFTFYVLLCCLNVLL